MSGERYEASIEALDGAFPASSWLRSWRDALVTSAISHGALEWDTHERRWGVVFDVAFADEVAFRGWIGSPTVRAALDAVPDPLAGLIVKRGWGGTSGRWEPRRPRPLVGSGAAALPIAEQQEGPEDPAPSGTGVPGSRSGLVATG